MTPKEIADVTGQQSANVRQLLGKIVSDGEQQTDGRGHYSVAEHAHHTDHSDGESRNPRDWK